MGITDISGSKFSKASHLRLLKIKTNCITFRNRSKTEHLNKYLKLLFNLPLEVCTILKFSAWSCFDLDEKI